VISFRPLPAVGLGALLILAGFAVAQRGSRGRGYGSYFDPTEEGFRPERGGVPDWELPTHMPDDVFTVVRIRYGGGRWGTD
jgi:hypothetical protein